MAKEKKALGTGLSALFGDDFENENRQETVPVTMIEPRADQPRKYFDEEALQSLADSIAKYGLIQPITVKKLDNGNYQIIAGERRWRASRLAGLEEVPVRIIEADELETAEMALVENLQREDLNPIEEAKGYKTLIEIYGLTQEEAAKSVGKSRPAVANSLRLLSLGDKVIEYVEAGDLSAGHARALASIENEEVQAKAAEEIIAKGLSVRKAEQLAARLIKEAQESDAEIPSESNSISVDYIKEVSEELSKKLGRRVNLKDGRKTGKLEIEYYGSEDREKLIELLRKI